MQKTIVNLTKAFIGESQARNRYTMYSRIAKKEGYETIMALFELTASQEAEHAKWLMRMINELKTDNKEFNEITVEASAPTILGNTKENLQSAINGENHEHSSMYPEFAKIAKEEGLTKVAGRLLAISIAEKNHESKYQKYLNELNSDTIFQKTETVTWVCRKCGYTHTANGAPEECPSCGHPKAYFEIKLS